MPLTKIVNFRTTKEQKFLMEAHAGSRGMNLSEFLYFLWVDYKKRKDNEAKMRAYVRNVTRRLVKQGIIPKGLCEDCGSEKVEAHHEDYYNPYKVRWFCRKHHKKHHPDRRKGLILKKGAINGAK